MAQGKIIIISGPSGSGKTTLHKKLLLSKKIKNNLVKSISATTRSPRENEKHGRDYLFLSHPEFLEMQAAGKFLEWQKVFDNYYGTPKDAAEKLLSKGKNVLLCIDVKGASVVSEQYPEAIKIFIKVPSLELLRERLADRGTENAADLKIRLETAKEELKEAPKYHYVIVNGDLDEAFGKLEETVLAALKPVKEPQKSKANED